MPSQQHVAQYMSTNIKTHANTPGTDQTSFWTENPNKFIRVLHDFSRSRTKNARNVKRLYHHVHLSTHNTNPRLVWPNSTHIQKFEQEKFHMSNLNLAYLTHFCMDFMDLKLSVTNVERSITSIHQFHELWESNSDLNEATEVKLLESGLVM